MRQAELASSASCSPFYRRPLCHKNAAHRAKSRHHGVCLCSAGKEDSFPGAEHNISTTDHEFIVLLYTCTSLPLHAGKMGSSPLARCLCCFPCPEQLMWV